MLYKYYFTILLISLCGLSASAQKENIYLVKNNGKHVSTRDSADFVRIISEPDSGATLFGLTDYYLSGKVKLKGKTSSTKGYVLEGTVVSYYESGKRKQIANYENGQLTGDVYDYYPNGKLYSAKQYYPGQRIIGGSLYDNFTFKICNDSVGKSLTTDGNGYFVFYNKNFENIREAGYVKLGLKDGEWKGQTSDSNKISYTEVYKQGILISGQSVDINGKTYKYTTQFLAPKYPSANNTFHKAIVPKFRTPAEYKALLEIPDSNKVFVDFYVEKDGSITDFKIRGNLTDKSRSELLEAVEKSDKKWIPGKLCGVPVRIFLSLPYNFL